MMNGCGMNNVMLSKAVHRFADSGITSSCKAAENCRLLLVSPGVESPVEPLKVDSCLDHQ
jgi:hypothetical protein